MASRRKINRKNKLHGKNKQGSIDDSCLLTLVKKRVPLKLHQKKQVLEKFQTFSRDEGKLTQLKTELLKSNLGLGKALKEIELKPLDVQCEELLQRWVEKQAA